MHAKKLIAASLAALTGLAAASAWADGPTFRERARVISSTPVYENVSTPRQQCWTESSGYSQDAPRGGNTAGAVIGAIAGGLLGSTVGGGNGKIAASAVGAATGAVVGDRYNSGGDGAYPQEVQRCRTVNDYRQQVVGYEVTYRYQGRDFTTRLPYNPGPWVMLRVNVDIAQNQGGQDGYWQH